MGVKLEGKNSLIQKHKYFTQAYCRLSAIQETFVFVKNICKS